MFELKPLHKEAIPAALAKAERYRLLNEPVQAESICLDVLRIDPDNQQALVMLLLALTDHLNDGLAEGVAQAQDVLPRLRDPYEQAYYAGIICERRAYAYLDQGAPGAGFNAHASLQEAMRWYEKAEAVRPPGNDDAILRWNTCARLMMRNPEIRERPEESFEHPLE
jgi:hypothetical protein